MAVVMYEVVVMWWFDVCSLMVFMWWFDVCSLMVFMWWFDVCSFPDGVHVVV